MEENLNYIKKLENDIENKNKELIETKTKVKSYETSIKLMDIENQEKLEEKQKTIDSLVSEIQKLCHIERLYEDLNSNDIINEEIKSSDDERNNRSFLDELHELDTHSIEEQTQENLPEDDNGINLILIGNVSNNQKTKKCKTIGCSGNGHVEFPYRKTHKRYIITISLYSSLN